MGERALMYMHRIMPVFPAAVLIAVLPAGCQTMTSPEDSLTAPPARVEDTDQFNNIFSVGDVWFAGQPTEDGLRWINGQGVATVFNIRAAAEMTERVPFDEPALIEDHGMTNVHIPVTPATYSAVDVEQFSRALAEARARGGVLVHCGSSNRVGALWAAYLAAKHGFDPGRAV